MANANQGRGKTAFREFKRDLRRATNDILASVKGGSNFSSLDLQNIYDLVLIVYVRDIMDSDLPNPQTWIGRGEKATQEQELRVLEKLSLEPVNLFQEVQPIDPDTIDNIDEEGNEIDINITEGSILGYTRINPGSIPRFSKLGLQRRNQVVLPGDLVEYITHVPYIIGIEPVFEDGKLKGFKLWVQD